jgi:tetratricopeptide (TPR) repeat protein
MSAAGVTMAVPLERRLANFRAARRDPGSDRATDASASGLAHRIAEALGGVTVCDDAGTLVRIEGPLEYLPVDRPSLAKLPGHPAADVPLVCLDTETTGLGTATGTLVFLVGVGWWEGSNFRRVQLVLPDHADEPTFLTALGDLIPAGGWLVTYNGRSFDWPLLVTRYRLGRRPPPSSAGHLDLLPFIRRVFRHRLPDARLRTVEVELLGGHRHGDVESWQIPAIYLDLLRGGPVEPLRAVARHNDEDVRSLARLLAYSAKLGDPAARRTAERGDLAGLARGYARQRCHSDALDCLDAALRGDEADSPRQLRPFEGRSSRLDRERLLAERARTLRRLGRVDDAITAWRDLADRQGPLAPLALIELAKGLEWRRHDPASALHATDRAGALADQSRQLGRPLPRLEREVSRRRRRLVGRLARQAAYLASYRAG